MEAVVIDCFLVCDVINFKIYLFESFTCMTKKSEKKDVEDEKSF